MCSFSKTNQGVSPVSVVLSGSPGRTMMGMVTEASELMSVKEGETVTVSVGNTGQFLIFLIYLISFIVAFHSILACITLSQLVYQLVSNIFSLLGSDFYLT